MSVDIATLGIKVDAKDVKNAGDELDNLADKGKKAEGATKSVTSAFDSLKGTLAALGLGVIAREVAQLADTYKNIQGRLGLVTSGTAELAFINEKLFSIAQRTRTEFEAVTDLYSSLARSTKALGTSQSDLLQVTETINQALIVSGANAASSEAALRQLGQGFASGALRGDELNSVLENTPRLAQAIADGMGVTVGQLRKLGAEGKITGEAVFNALKTQKEAIEKEFATMPVTISQSFVQLNNEILKFVGEADKGSGASSAFAAGVQLLAANLDDVAVVIEVLAVAFGVKLVASFVASTAAAVAQQAALIGLTTTAEVAGFAVGVLAARLLALSALGGIAYLFVALANNVATTDVAFSRISRTAAELKTKLEGTGEGAKGAGGQVGGLGKDALGSIPKIDAFGGRVGAAAQQLYGMARAARAARVEMLQTQLAQSQKDETTAMKATKAGQNLVIDQNWSNFRKGDFLALDPSASVNSVKSVLSNGRTDREADAAYSQAYQNSANLQKQLREARNAPIGLNDLPTSSGGGATAANDNKKGGGGKSSAQTEREQAVKASQDYIDQMKIETDEIGKNEIQQHRMAAAREAAKAPTEALRMEILKAADAWEVATVAEEAKTKATEEAKKAAEKAVQDNKQQLADGKAMADAIAFENSLLGMNAKEREIAMATRDLELRHILEGTEAYKLYAAAILGAAVAHGQLELDADKANDFANAMRDVAASIREATEGFNGYFGTGVEGFANLMEVVSEYGAKRADIEAEIADAKARGRYSDEDAAKYQQRLATLEMNNYGNMLGAAKTFFNEKSKGYKILQAAEMAYRMFQFAMSVKAMIFDAAETSSSVGKSGIRAAAHAVEAVAKAIASLPFPFNLIAGAATAAALAAIGLKVFGGGGGGSSAATGNMGGDGSTDTATSAAGFNSLGKNKANNNYNVTMPTSSNDNSTAIPKNSGGFGTQSFNQKIVIENAPEGFYLQAKSITHDEVRFIARSEVNESAPKAVAADMANPNSSTAKSMQANFEVARRR